MIIIHDKRLPKDAINNLQSYGECLSFYSENVTYEEIAGHPDIFFFQIDNLIIVAPNTPSQFIINLESKNIPFVFGKTPVGFQKETSTCYNAVVSDNYLIHNKNFTDPTILEYCNEKSFIRVNQAYTRCSLLPLKNDCFITSDKGIEKELLKHKIECLYLSPKEILLPGFRNGFIGGCMGVHGNKVFLVGNPDFHPEGEKLKNFLHTKGYELVSLYNGRFFDGGSLLFSS